MSSVASLTTEIISLAESHGGIRAGIAHLEDVLKGPSYKAAQAGPRYMGHMNEVSVDEWPTGVQTVLILGMNHPENDPRLDYWDRGDTRGNRFLRELSESMQQWLRRNYDLTALPLPYYVEKGGLFLKDAAILSGMGIIGRNNLLLHPEWGPRIRLRAILLEGDFHTTEALDDFTPCDSCDLFCQKACPVQAFPEGKYRWSVCAKQMRADVENKAPDEQIGESGKRHLVIKYCRACELSCPVGA